MRKLSGTFIDMALPVDRPIVLVRFVGGLPVEPLAERTELPVGMGRQDFYIGRPIPPDELRPLSYRQRGERLMAAINDLGPNNEVEEPLPPDPAFEAAVHVWMSDTGASLGHATLLQILEQVHDRSPDTSAVLHAARTGDLPPQGTPGARWLARLAQHLL